MARDIEAARAYVTLMLKKKGFLAGLGQAKKMLASFARGAAGLAVSAARAAIAPMQASIQAASDLEETMNKFNVVFGQNARAMKEWGDEFAGQVGRSQKQVAEFLANTQDLLVPIGFEAGAAEEMSKQVTQLAFDLASFNNMQDADTIRDMHAALTGSGEVMKKYGVVLSEAAVKQELLNTRIDPKKATEQEKAQARLNIIMRGTTAAQGDAVRSAGSYANQMKAVQAALSDAAAAFGQILLPVLAKFSGAAVEIINRAVEMRDKIAPVFAAWATATWDTFTAIQDIITTVWGNVSNSTTTAMGSMSDSLISYYSTVSFVFKNWRKIVEMATLSAQLSVIRWGNQVAYVFGTVIPGYLSWFADNWRDILIDAGNLTRDVTHNMMKNFQSLFQGLMSLMRGEGFTFEWTPLTEGFRSAIKELPQIAEREMGPMEKSLQDQLNAVADEVVGKAIEHRQEFAAKMAELSPVDPLSIGGGGASLAGGGGAAQNVRAATDRIFTSFSAAAAAAQGNGAGTVEKRTLNEIEKGNRENREHHRKLRQEMRNAFRVA